tara:strand:- start:485 stop:850 length:366 start_codon:yes stop_codon:yes gene_type:complete
MEKTVLLILFISLNIHAQCDWNSYFPFQAGNSKFDIARIKSTNPTIADTEDNYGMRDAIAKINNGFHKFEYLKDSVYINVINLRFVNNSCSKIKVIEYKLHYLTTNFIRELSNCIMMIMKL